MYSEGNIYALDIALMGKINTPNKKVESRKKMKHTITISRDDLYILIWSLSSRKERFERLLRKEKLLSPLNSKKVSFLSSCSCDVASLLERLQSEWIGGAADEK